MPQRRFALLRPTRRRRPRRRRGRRDAAPPRRDALPRQQALRGRVVLHMHLIQTLDAPRRVVPPHARVGAAPRPAVEARVFGVRAATRVRRFTHQTVRRAPLREVLEDQAAAGSVRPGSRPPLHDRVSRPRRPTSPSSSRATGNIRSKRRSSCAKSFRSHGAFKGRITFTRSRCNGRTEMFSAQRPTRPAKTASRPRNSSRKSSGAIGGCLEKTILIRRHAKASWPPHAGWLVFARTSASPVVRLLLYLLRLRG